MPQGQLARQHCASSYYYFNHPHCPWHCHYSRAPCVARLHEICEARERKGKRHCKGKKGGFWYRLGSSSSTHTALLTRLTDNLHDCTLRATFKFFQFLCNISFKIPVQIRCKMRRCAHGTKQFNSDKRRCNAYQSTLRGARLVRSWVGMEGEREYSMSKQKGSKREQQEFSIQPTTFSIVGFFGSADRCSCTISSAADTRRNGVRGY